MKARSNFQEIIERQTNGVSLKLKLEVKRTKVLCPVCKRANLIVVFYIFKRVQNEGSNKW